MITHVLHLNSKKNYLRGVVPGGAGGPMAPPDFVISVNPISTTKGGGADYACQIILASPDFQTFLRS